MLAARTYLNCILFRMIWKLHCIFLNLVCAGLLIPQQRKWDRSTAPSFTAVGAVQKRGCTQMDEHLWPSNVPGPCGDPHSWCPETHSQWATVIDASYVYVFCVNSCKFIIILVLFVSFVVVFQVPWLKPFATLPKAWKVGSIMPWMPFHKEWSRLRYTYRLHTET